MFSLSIVFGNVSWRFLFRDEDKANNAVALLSTHPTQDLIIHDDFGQKATIKAPAILGWMLENLDETQLVLVEDALHKARAQKKFNARVESDPALRMQQMRAPVLTPSFGNGRA